MSKRVRRRAILSCKPKSYTQQSGMIVDYWYDRLHQGDKNQEPAYMLKARNIRQGFQNVLAAMTSRLSVENLKSVSKSRAIGLSEITEEEMKTINPRGTVTGRFNSSKPNKGGQAK
ncbi:hypothetical protein QCM8_264 [Bacillus phage QCM8]|nr:hypothetical protein QCM8_264 [Bacillus phage QCM8]